MKRVIKNIPIMAYDGTPLQVPIYENGKIKLKRPPDGKEIPEPEVKDATLADCLMMLVRFFPKELMTMENVIQGNRLYGLIRDTKEEFTLKDASYSWTTNMLKNDKVGLAIFGMNCPAVLEALTGESIIPPEGD